MFSELWMEENAPNIFLTWCSLVPGNDPIHANYSATRPGPNPRWRPSGSLRNVHTGGVVCGTSPSCGLFRQRDVQLCCIEGIDHVFHNNLCPLSTSFQWFVFLDIDRHIVCPWGARVFCVYTESFNYIWSKTRCKNPANTQVTLK